MTTGTITDLTMEICLVVVVTLVVFKPLWNPMSTENWSMFHQCLLLSPSTHSWHTHSHISIRQKKQGFLSKRGMFKHGINVQLVLVVAILRSSCFSNGGVFFFSSFFCLLPVSHFITSMWFCYHFFSLTLCTIKYVSRVHVTMYIVWYIVW